MLEANEVNILMVGFSRFDIVYYYFNWNIVEVSPLECY